MGRPFFWNESFPAMTPDSPPVALCHPSPNHGERQAGPTDAIILHYTGMETGEAALDLLCSPAAQVSCHYLVWEDGRVWQLVPEARRAWHAGKSFWAGETDMNSRSIGIEIVNPGPGRLASHRRRAALSRRADRGGDRAVPRHHDARGPFRRSACWRIPTSRRGARSIPARSSPGLACTKRASATGSPPARSAPARFSNWAPKGPQVAALQDMLAAYGYGVGKRGAYDATTRDAVAAFQRHFRPAWVDGVADASTVETLRALSQALLPTR